MTEKIKKSMIKIIKKIDSKKFVHLIDLFNSKLNRIYDRDISFFI